MREKDILNAYSKGFTSETIRCNFGYIKQTLLMKDII